MGILEAPPVFEPGMEVLQTYLGARQAVYRQVGQ